MEREHLNVGGHVSIAEVEQVTDHASSDPLDHAPPVAATAPRPTRPTDPYASRERHHNEGHGRRLTAAFEALEAYPMLVEARTPEERIASERRELGVDHALVGGVLARRWGLPKAVASVIERHHAGDTDGEAALVRLADMLAHYVLGGAISPSELLSVARSINIKPPQLRTVMYDLPLPSAGTRPRPVAPCPR